MASNNLERMIQLAEDVFAVKSDPDQLDVDQEVMERLKRIHHASVSEMDYGNGPVAWLILIPTTMDLMHRFLAEEITEKQLFELTPLDVKYDAFV